MSRRRLPAAGLGGMFSLAARVPIFSGYYTTPAMEGKGRADCASAARGPPLGSREERGLSGDFPLAVFLEDAAGVKALSIGFCGCGSEEGVFLYAAGRAAAYRPYGRVRALPWFSFGLTPNKGKVAVFLKESRLKNFYARCARPLTVSAAPRRFPPLPARRPRRADSSYIGWGFAASPPHTAGPAAAAGPSSSS